MKIAIIGANGRAGSLIAQEAVSRGHEVSAIVRGNVGPEHTQVISKDLFELTYADVEGFDVVVNAFAAWTPETLNQHVQAAQHLCNLLADKPNRLLIIGGAGSLYVNPEHTVMLMDTPDFPEMFMGVAKATGEALDVYRTATSVNWTNVSPAADFRADGPRTGTYTLGSEELLVDSEGVPQASYADYAIAMLDLAEGTEHIHERVCVVAK